MKRRTENGFTLVELIVVIAISGVVMAAIYATFFSQQKSYKTTEDVVAVQQNLRGAMYYMEREIRIAGYDPLRTNAFGITGITSQSITMTMDFGTENGTIENNEEITYAYDAGNRRITREAGAGAQVIAENVTNLTISGLDASENPTTVPANVRSVDLSITGSLGGHSRTYASRIRCRNMGL